VRHSAARLVSAAATLLAALAPARAATLRLPLDAAAAPGAPTTVSLYVDDATGFLGTDLQISYDPSVAAATAVATTSLSASQTLTVNLSPQGQIRISLFGAYPLSGGGVFLRLTFTALGGTLCQTDLRFDSAEINEGGIAAFTQNGHLQVQGPPGEVRNMRVSLSAPGSRTAALAWDADAGAASYNVYRGGQASLSDLGCFASGVTGTSATDDGALPAPGRLFVYLVTARNCNGESTLGFSSSGTERANRSPCP